jgi:hypothetical protein
MTRTEPSSGVRLFSPPSVLAVAFHSLLARPAAFSAERRWYAQAFAADPDTAVVPPVLAVLSVLYRRGLRRTRLRLLVRLFRYPWLRARLLSLLLRVGPLLLLHLTLALQRLLALFRRLFVPRHFVELRWLLTHISLHLRQQLALLIGQLIGVQHLAAGRRFGRRTYARLTAFQLFNVSPALFRFWRDAITGDFLVLQRFGLFFLVMRNEVQTTDKGHEYGCSNSNHCGRYRRRIALFFP